MQIHHRICCYFRQHRPARILLGHLCVLLAVAAFFFGGPGNVLKTFAQSRCSSSDSTYIVVSGDTLSGIATRYNISWQSLATHNNIGDPNLIYVNEAICIPDKGQKPVKGSYNPFPHGQCTWWADQRYHQLHSIYVPWVSGSDAWKWTARAHQYHWHVSKHPSVGAILNLQPWVQGAHGLGHVAVVEKVLKNGHVIASSMNWGGHPGHVVTTEFTPGSGVSFITF